MRLNLQAIYIDVHIGSSAIMAVGYSRGQASISLEPYLRHAFQLLDVYGASLLWPDKRRRPRPHSYVCVTPAFCTVPE
jgi:hypothetical protein